MDNNKEKYVLLSMIPGFGVKSQARLVRLCGGIENCFSMPDGDMLDACRNALKENGIGRKRLELFLRARGDGMLKARAEEVLRGCMQKGIRIVTAEEAEYPARFFGLDGMPLVLYVRGRLAVNGFARSVGVVGARRCSAEGKACAIKAVEEEVRRGAAIVSGMAKGIDSYAHTAAIKNSGYTIAVLGNGPDICYPKEHGKLYEAIAETGCILSEYPPGREPREYMFPERNRLIAALSDELYVIDAGSRSGTRTTVESCLAYSRPVKYIQSLCKRKSDTMLERW